YVILEVSPDLAERQRSTIAHEARAYRDRVCWVSALPDAIDGALIANEVLDAVAPHVIARRSGEYFERGVTWDDAQSEFAWAERPADPPLANLAATRFPQGVDYVSEINPAAEALVETIGTRIVAGAAL